MIVIGRPIEGIGLNGLEYLMEDENNEKLKQFNDVAEAKDFLRETFKSTSGEEVSDDDLEDSFFFVDTKDLIPVGSDVNSDNPTPTTDEE